MRVRRSGLGVAVLLAGAVCLWAASAHIDGAVARRAAINILQLAGAIAAAAVAGARARRASGRPRSHLLLLSLAALCWAAGQTYWSVSEVLLARPVPFPSLADVGFLASFPLMVASLVVAPGSRSHAKSGMRSSLDWLVVASSMLFVSWALMLDTVFSGLDLSTTEGVLGLVYPLADVLLLTFAASTVVRARSPWLRSLAVVSGGLAAVAVADIGFSYPRSIGAYSTGSVVDLGWIVGWSLIAVGASSLPQGADSMVSRDVDQPGRVARLLPLAALAAVVTTATVRHVGGQPFTADPVLGWSGLALFVLSVARSVAARAEGDAYAAQLIARSNEMRDLLNRHAIAFESSAMGTWYIDLATGVVRGSEDLERLFRVLPGHFDVSVDEAIRFVHPDDVDRAEASVMAALESHVAIDFEAKAVRGDGTLMWLRCQGRPVTDDSGTVIGIVGAVTDVTDRVTTSTLLEQRAHQGVSLAELGLRAMTADLSATLDDSVEAIAATLGTPICQVLQLEPDGEHLRLVAGRGWSAGLIGRATVGAGLDSQAGYTLAHTEPVVVEDLLTETRFTGTALLYDHGVRSGMSTIISTAGGPWGVLGVHSPQLRDFTVEDVSFLRAVANTIGAAVDRAFNEEQRRFRSLHDALTGLPNRSLLEDRLAVGIAGARTAGKYVAVVHLGLDRFTLVNTSLGVAVGDQVLIEVATRLAGICNPGDSAARLDGDEFVVAATVEDAHGAIELAGRVLAVIGEPLVAGDPAEELFLSASLGVALANGVGDAVSLLRDASIAADRASARGGRRYEVFDDRFRDRAVHRLRLEADLRHAIAAGQINPHFQPIHRIATGELAGVEALARWNHPTRGLLGPAEFLDTAQAAGLAGALGETILLQSVHHAARWNTQPGASVKVSVNVATSQLEPGIFDLLRGALSTSGLSPEQLCLEIVESALADDTSQIQSLLTDLRAHWPIGIHIDDFGTGHSSLSRLATLPVTGIKIDRAFIAALGHDPTAPAVVAAIIELGHALGLEVTAEGVETNDQLHILSDLGCDLAQGWLFARAMPAEEIDLRRAAPAQLVAACGQPE